MYIRCVVANDSCYLLSHVPHTLGGPFRPLSLPLDFQVLCSSLLTQFCYTTYQINHKGQNWNQKVQELLRERPTPFVTLGLDQFARFYDRVHLLAPLDGTVPHINPLTSSGTIPSTTESTEDTECMICMEHAIEVVLPDCNHAFCRKCLDEWTSVSKTCPMCRSYTESNDTLWVMAENPTSDQLYTSLLDLLQKLRNESASSSDS